MTKKDIGLLLLILVVSAAVALQNPLFLSPINLANTANLIGLFGIVAIGQAIVIITGGIELSVGSIICLLGVLFVDLLVTYALPWPVVVVLILIIGVLIGLLHGLMITRLGLQPFIVTLCGLLIYRGAARFYTADATAGFKFGQTFPMLEQLTIGRLAGVPVSFLAMLVIAGIMWVLLHRSVFGRYLQAVGKNEEAARFSGIPTQRVGVMNAPVIPQRIEYWPLARLRCGLGAALLLSGRLDEGVAALEQALAEAPNYTASLVGLAWGYWELGRTDHAQRLGQLLLAREPGMTITATLRDSPYKTPEMQRRQRAYLCGVGIPD